MRVFKASIYLICIISTAAIAASDGWYFVARSKDSNDEYSVKLGSGARDSNKQGDSMTVVVGKISHKKENNIDIYKWYVTDSDCSQEYGNLVVLDIDGNFKFETPFAKGSNTIGSAIAEAICAAAAANDEKVQGKGI